MEFREAFAAMKNGKRVKLPSWGGYWAWEDGSIKMHCKDGRVLDIRESENVDFTMSNVASGDWMVAGINDVEINPAAMSFSSALYELKRGKKIARAGWNGKEQYIELATCISYTNANGAYMNVEHEDIGSKAIAFVGTRGVQLGWLASQSDMLANDWHIVG